MSVLTTFERLSQSLRVLQLHVGAVNQQLIEKDHHKEIYIEQGIVNFQVTSASQPLMKEVIRCAKLLDNTDPLAAPLIDYMEHHIPEEDGHDEWALQDLEEMGVTRTQAKLAIPSTNIATLIGSQYYWIRHYHPVAFMGYLACLEVNHPTVEFVEQLITNSGLPEKAFSSLMHHAKVDVHHKQDIINVINSLELTESQYQIIELSAFQTYRHIALAIKDVCNSVSHTHKVA